MQLNFDAERAKGPKLDWAERDLWKQGERVSFEVSNAELLEVVKDGDTRLKARLLLKVLTGENAGKHTTKDVWDPIANKGSQGYLKAMLDTMGVSKEKLNGGNVPLALAEAAGAKFTAVCEKANGGKWVNWNELQPHK